MFLVVGYQIQRELLEDMIVRHNEAGRLAAKWLDGKMCWLITFETFWWQKMDLLPKTRLWWFFFAKIDSLAQMMEWQRTLILFAKKNEVVDKSISSSVKIFRAWFWRLSWFISTVTEQSSLPDSRISWANFHSDWIITNFKPKRPKFHRWPNNFVRYCI